MNFPDRITPLIKHLEAGDTITQADVDRVVMLQLLDMARLREDFARETMQREAEHTEIMRQSFEQLNKDLAPTA